MKPMITIPPLRPEKRIHMKRDRMGRVVAKCNTLGVPESCLTDDVKIATCIRCVVMTERAAAAAEGRQVKPVAPMDLANEFMALRAKLVEFSASIEKTNTQVISVLKDIEDIKKGRYR